MHEQATATEQGQAPSEHLSDRERFLYYFQRLLQTARIHGSDNRLWRKASEEFAAAGASLLSEAAEITIEARHDRLYVQKERLLVKQQTAAVIFSILGLFENLSLYGLRFREEISRISDEKAYVLARTFLDAQGADKPHDRLKAMIDRDLSGWLEIMDSPKGPDEPEKTAELAHKAYSFAYNSVKELVHSMQMGQRAGARKSMRVVQDITDLVFIDKRILLGMATIRDYDDYTFTHSVNVAIQSICLGHEIGLSRNSLVRLGICGLFHDLGKVMVPKDILNKPDYLNHEEYQTIKKHPLNSVRQILKLDAYRDLIAQIILPPFEHHMNYDLSGYPEVDWSRSISLFGRIIEICDVYDAMTAPRVYRNSALSQDRALGLMLAKSGREFDPLLLKWFINMVGVYPVGTLVRLNTGEIGLIHQGTAAEEGRLPKILLIRKTANKKLAAGGVVDLNELDATTGRPHRWVRSTHNPYHYGIQPAVFLMQA